MTKNSDIMLSSTEHIIIFGYSMTTKYVIIDASAAHYRCDDEQATQKEQTLLLMSQRSLKWRRWQRQAVYMCVTSEHKRPAHSLFLALQFTRRDVCNGEGLSTNLISFESICQWASRIERRTAYDDSHSQLSPMNGILRVRIYMLFAVALLSANCTASIIQ